MSSAVRAPLGGALLGSAGVAVIGVLALACEPEHWEEGATVCGTYEAPDVAEGLPTPEWVEFWPEWGGWFCGQSGSADSAGEYGAPPWEDSGAFPEEISPIIEGYFSASLPANGTYLVLTELGHPYETISGCSFHTPAAGCVELRLP